MRLCDNPYRRSDDNAEHDWELGWKTEHWSLLAAGEAAPEIGDQA
jgi:hypothetical protein